MASSPAIVVCTVCHMNSLSVSVSNEGFKCDNCREIVRLTEKILELETCIQSLVEDSKNVRAVDTALDATTLGSPVHCSVLALEPIRQSNWVTVRRPSHGSKHCSSSKCFRYDQNIKQVLPTQWRTHWETWCKCSSYWQFYCTDRENRDTSHHSPLFTGSQHAWHIGKFKSAG